MNFKLYTEKTIPQCAAALNERMQAKPTSTRPELAGWIEKGGRFSLAVSSRVFGTITRTTRLSGVMQRDSGVTVIQGYVSDGVTPQWQKILGVMLVLVCVILLLAGQAVLALVSLLVGVAAFVPFRGDYENSETLLIELERTLKASPKMPGRKSTVTTKAVPLARPATMKPAVAKSQTTAKPSAGAKPATTSKPAPKPYPKPSAKPEAARKGK